MTYSWHIHAFILDLGAAVPAAFGGSCISFPLDAVEHVGLEALIPNQQIEPQGRK